MARFEVITGPERRRRWSADQKRAIVAESFAPGAVVSEVARRADVSPGQIYRWRQELRAAAGFAQVLIAPAENPEPKSAPPCAAPAIEVELRSSGSDSGIGAGGIGGGGPQGAVAAMIPVPSGVRVWLAVGHTDMRRGMDSLALQVQEKLGRDPHAGDLYVFRGKRGQRATFCIRFSVRDDRLSLASAVRADVPGIAISARQGVDVHLYG